MGLPGPSRVMVTQGGDAGRDGEGVERDGKYECDLPL